MIFSGFVLFCFFVYLAISDGIDKKYPFKKYNSSTNFIPEKSNEMQEEIEDDREESFLQELIDHLVSGGAEDGFKYIKPVSKRLSIQP